MTDSESAPDRFRALVAVLIALVSVMGALTSWRVSVALGNAGGEDSAALSAVAEKEYIATYAAIVVMQHRDAFVAYAKDDLLAKAYEVGTQGKPERTDLSDYARALRSAANHALDAIPQAYIDREGHLDQVRDMGEHIAQGARDKDVEPLPHFASADAARQKALGLIAAIILLGLVLLSLTLADAAPNRLRYLWLGSGIGLFSLAVSIVLLVELPGLSVSS